MKIEIDFSKSVQENASLYFEKSKKAKKKLAGLEQAIRQMQQKISSLEEKKRSQKEPHRKREREWFEAFHWFHTSDRLLVLAGRDAQSNERLVKKFMSPADLYFHADLHGAAHCILKAEKNSAPQNSLKEAAAFAALWSKAWKEGLSHADVYCVLPEQVSKSAPSGEAISGGAFMIYGKRKWFRKTKIECSIGVQKIGEMLSVVSGPVSAVKKNSLYCVELLQGDKTKSEAAKQLKAVLSKRFPNIYFELDEIISMLPNGGIRIAQNAGN